MSTNIVQRSFRDDLQNIKPKSIDDLVSDYAPQINSQDEHTATSTSMQEIEVCQITSKVSEPQDLAMTT